MCWRSNAWILCLGVQVSLDYGRGVGRRWGGGERSELDTGGGAACSGDGRSLLDLNRGLALVGVGAAVGATAHNGGHGGNGGLDGTVAVHRGDRGALSMLRALRCSHCHGWGCARHDCRLGRVCVRAPGSGLRRSSGHGGGRS